MNKNEKESNDEIDSRCELFYKVLSFKYSIFYQ